MRAMPLVSLCIYSYTNHLGLPSRLENIYSISPLNVY